MTVTESDIPMQKQNKDLRIIFMGTPEFAVPSLDILLQNDYNVVGVITAPDKPAGRGMKSQSSAIKKYALQNNLNVLQPAKLKDPGFLNDLKELQPDLQVVVAFRMLPEVVWQLPPLGTFNLHASLLPQYRGAAPINWAIINGEQETGVTTFFLEHEIDTGKIIFQQTVPISDNETAGELHDKLKIVGAELVLKTVKAIENGSYELIPQRQFSELKKAPKIFTEDARIDWKNDIQTIYNKIRGLSPYPAAFTIFNGKILKIFSSQMTQADHNLPFGNISTDGKTFFRFAAENGFIEPLELQPEAKKRMTALEFLRGSRLNPSNSES